MNTSLNLILPPLTNREEIRAAYAVLSQWGEQRNLWSYAYGYGTNSGSTYHALVVKQSAWRQVNTFYHPSERHPLFFAWDREYLRLCCAIDIARAALHPVNFFNRERRTPVFVNTFGQFSSEAVILDQWESLSAGKRGNYKTWLEARTGNDYVCCEDGPLVPSDDAYWCPLSEVYYSTDDDFVTYHTARCDSEQGHKDAVRGQCFFCERSREWFDRNDFSMVDVDGETVCYEWYEDDLYCWDSDGEYHWESEPEDDDDDDSRGRAGYHSNVRPRSWTNASRQYGIENEVEVHNNMEDFCYALANSGLFTEEDGSLNTTRGVEVVGGPFTLEQYQQRQTAWEAFFRRVSLDDVRGHAAGTGYGMHVNMSRDHFTSTLHLSKFTVLLNQMERLCKVVAQRESVYNGSYKTRCKVCKETSTRKFEPVNVTDNRVEVRIFRANARPERMIKNIEFCDAAKEFAKLASIQAISEEIGATAAFLQWLGEPAHRTSYPALVAFLGETFPGCEQWKKKTPPTKA